MAQCRLRRPLVSSTGGGTQISREAGTGRGQKRCGPRVMPRTVTSVCKLVKKPRVCILKLVMSRLKQGRAGRCALFKL